MTEKERQEIVEILFAAIFAAHNAVQHEGNPPFEDCHTFAYAALANLEAHGFKVVRNA